MEANVLKSRGDISITCSPHFPEFLHTNIISVGITTYQTNRLFLIGLKQNNNLSTFERLFDRPMGLHAESNRLFLATRFQIWQLDNILDKSETDNGYDRLFVPRKSYTTGDLETHDLCLDHKQRPLFVNTLYSCLATVSERHSFELVWKPPFISRLLPEDRCHLNGLAMENGNPKYVTAVSRSDEATGWRNRRGQGGVLIDVDSNEIVCDNLSMPHSPRIYRDKLWVLSAGTGELGHIDCHNGRFEPLAFCPGFLRGLAFHDRFALVSLSLPRYNKMFSGLSLDAALAGKDMEPFCGIMVVDLETGATVHWLRFEGRVVTELYDVQVLPGIRCPSLLGFVNDQIKHTISFCEQKQIVRHHLIEKNDVQSRDHEQTAPFFPTLVTNIPSHVPQGVVIIRLSMSSQEIEDRYAGLTYPSIRQRLAVQKLNEPLACSLAIVGSQTVAMAVAEIREDGNATFISLMVLSPHRNQGIGTRLIQDLQQQVEVLGAAMLSVQYRINWTFSKQFEHILQKCHWPEPVLHSLQCRTDIKHISKAPWLQKSPLSSDFSLFPWAELSLKERQHIQERTDYPPFLTPFQEESRISWQTSFGLRKEGRVIGWLITHQTKQDTIQYTSLFIEPGHRHAACGLNLLAAGIHNQIKLNISFFIFMINAGNSAGQNLTNRRIRPYLLSAVETRYCAIFFDTPYDQR